MQLSKPTPWQKYERCEECSDNSPALGSQNPSSLQLKQEIGLVEVHLSRLDQELGQQNQANEEMRKAQAELTALGWKNISSDHLIALTKQLDSEYQNPKQRNAATAAPKKLSASLDRH